MPFFAQKFILFDVQTTGTNPETSAILEAGWGLYHAGADPETMDWQVRLVSLGENVSLSRRIQKLTGLAPATWNDEGAVSYESLSAEIGAFLREHEGLPILVHYARFKRPFLYKTLADAKIEGWDELWSTIRGRIACTYELARRMMPHLKSYSLRAVAGYAGYSLADRKRSRDHLVATAHVWRYMVTEASVGDRPATRLPLQDAAIRHKRLSLPDAPGVYFFLDQAQRILYVGKASSLKHRLNSYFRGQKTKGSRLNEMLTRAVDFQYHVVGSELEALFLESDAIKRLDPPYNRLLKTDERHVQTICLKDWLLPRDEASPGPAWTLQTWGPFLSLWNFQWLLALSGLPMKPEALPSRRWVEHLLDDAAVADAKLLLLGSDTPDADAWQTWAHKVWETWLLERQSKDEDVDDLDEDDTTTSEDQDGKESPAAADDSATTTLEEAAAFLQHTLLHALRQRHRARWLLRLMDCTIQWTPRDRTVPYKGLSLRKGVPTFHGKDESLPPLNGGTPTRMERMQAVDLATYDRLTILYGELRKGLRRGDQIQLCWRPGLCLDQDQLRLRLL